MSYHKFCLFFLSASVLIATEPTFELVPSAPDQIATLLADEESLIGGIVSPLSGQVSLHTIDLMAKGAEDIVLSRTYIAPPVAPPATDQQSKWQAHQDRFNFLQSLQTHYRGWTFLPHLYATVRNGVIRLTDRNGSTLDFNLSDSKLLTEPYGLNNASRDTPWGANDPRNTRISLNGKLISVLRSDGRTLSYAQADGFCYTLEKEILPNGKVLRYVYKDSLPIRIESLDPKERYIYASISLEGINLHGSPRTELCRAKTSCGDTSEYTSPINTIQESTKTKRHSGKYEMTFPPELFSASTPFFRSEAICYSPYMQLESYVGKQLDFRCSYAPIGGQGSALHVKKLSLPAGKNGEQIPIYEMSYDPPHPGKRGGSTTALRADGVKIVYEFSSKFLTEAVKTYHPNGSLSKEKRLSWNAENRLEAVELKNGHGELLYRKEFTFDKWGNPIVERFSGQLTGDEKLETRTILREYSQEGRHLLLREETEEGKVLVFRYLPGTNLPTVKYTLAGTDILLREFWEYDDCHNLIEKICDDGTSEEKSNLNDVTQRTIKRYRLRQEAPFLHMVEWVEDFCLEKGAEKLLRKTQFHYDRRGNIVRECVYGSDGQFAYQIESEIDEQGNVLFEIDPLGNKLTTRYNNAGRPVSIINRSGKLETRMYYDTKGRLKRTEERAGDGTQRAMQWEFDALDRTVQQTDYLGRVTTYQPDPITGNSERTNRPPILALDGTASPVCTTAKFDPFGRKIEDMDENGNKTTTRFNAYEKPLEIVYADGSKEIFRYYKNGNLRSHTNEDGLTISYEWDILDRIVRKKFDSIAEEQFTYDRFQLRSQTNKNGHITQWDYDGAGRKISETREGRLTQFQYDSLGMLSSMSYSGLLTVEYTRDLLGRILEERKTDPSGKVCTQVGYGFDPDGNRTSVTRYPNDRPATEIGIFDPFSRLIEKVDPLGNRTLISYDEVSTDALDQRRLTVTSIDPNGIATVLAYDPSGNQVFKQIGPTCAEEKTYDPAGNLLQIEEGASCTRYTYDSRYRIASLTRAFGTKQARTTSYTYGEGGRLSTKTLPSGMTLSYSYDLLGNPKSLASADGQILQAFDYSLDNHLLFASDGNHTIERKWDAFGNILEETVDGKLTLYKTYDQLNRLLTLSLPGGSSVQYSYSGPFLRDVTRYCSNNTQYKHTYSSYDLSGAPISEQMIFRVGEIKREYNLRGQVKTITSPYFTQVLEYDPAGRVSSIGDQQFSYDEQSQIIAESDLRYQYDSHHNRVEKNESLTICNELDEIDDAHDLDGNFTQGGYQYDPLQRLIQAKDVVFAYDPLSRCVSRKMNRHTELYLYQGAEELGAFSEDGEPKVLKILGLANKPIAIELPSGIYAPIVDHRGDIRRLVGVTFWQPTENCDYTTFGEERSGMPKLSPWRYSSKRYDEKLGLYYFGNRWYDPSLGRWLTLDPAGFVDGTNLYTYARNNPLLYVDPTGILRFRW